MQLTDLRCAAAGLMAGLLSAAHADAPRVWCWSAPEGPAASRAALVPLVLVWIPPGGADPTTTADQVCDAIVARNLGAGDIAITILNWGRGTLIGNPLDAMTGTGLSDTLNRGTPWAANGIAAMGAWTEAFIARYQHRQIVDGIPSPSRFHMDSELRLPALCYLPDIDDCWGTAPLQVFDAMQDDPRWAVERLPMNPAGIPALLTMAELHAAGGSPGHDASLPRDHPVNRAWSAWWDGVMREAVEGAFDAALFSRVHQAWPEASCSEFAQSMRLDGGIEPGGGRREYVDFEWWNEGWMRSAWCGRADLQAPAFYVFGETFVDPDRPFMDEQMRLHRANLDACLHSFGGAAPETITPWVTLPGIALPFGEAPPTSRAYSDSEFLRLIALFRSRGIEEFMVWPSAGAGTWSAVASAIDATWMPSLTGIDALHGSLPADALTLVERADRLPAVADASTGGIDLVVHAKVQQPDECDDRGVLWIAIESTCPSDATWSLSMLDDSGAWTSAGSFASVAGSPNAAWIGPIEAPRIVSDSGTVSMRLSGAGAPSLAIDLVQVVHAPSWTSASSSVPPCGCIADLTGNGSVDGADLGIMLSAWGATGQQGTSIADLNRDGTVNGADLGLMLSAWGACAR
jgi:hypothetical protein